MTRLVAISVLLALLAMTTQGDDDLGFDFDDDAARGVGSDDLEVELDDDDVKEARRRIHHYRQTGDGGENNLTAVIGGVFHWVVPKENYDEKIVQSYEARRSDGGSLPMWLLFDKMGGVFWGVPLADDLTTLHIVVKPVGPNVAPSQITLKITVAPSTAVDENAHIGNTAKRKKCAENEDRTILTLLIDRGIRSIKPKQRVVGVNNIAKFFGLSYSAFTLKPQDKVTKDDITDSSVVLAGPGDLKSRSSKLTSVLQVPVGCDGRLWLETAPLIHQLKQQARDGTISEVLGLPLIGWRVKTESKPPIAISRSKRQATNGGKKAVKDDDDSIQGDYGSGGDYEDYYDDYEDEEYDDDSGIGDSGAKSGSTTQAPVAKATTVVGVTSSGHPHRHHHGEENVGESEIVPVVREPETSASGVVKSTTTTTTPKTTTPLNTDDYEEYDYDDDTEDDTADDIDTDESRTVVPPPVIPKVINDTTTSSTTTTTTAIPTSPKATTTTEAITTTITTTTTTTTSTSTPSTTTTSGSEIVEDTELQTIVYTEDGKTFVTEPVTVKVVTASDSVEMTTVTDEMTHNTTPVNVTSPTTPLAVENETTVGVTLTAAVTESDSTTVMMTTTPRHVISTPRSTTTVREIITERVDMEQKNFPPYIDNRLQQQSVVAGKIFRFVIPKNTFKDFEDGNDLLLELLNSKAEPLGKDSWCHFNPTRREVYGLPLEEDVSKWEYVIRATDREGASVSDKLTVQVQQHKLQRVVNHELSLVMRIEKQQEFPHFVDWCLKTLRALGKIYNTNMTEITVRNVSYGGEPVVFTWTNDSIPTTNQCPTKEIDQLFDVITANDRGDPARELNLLLSPELRVKEVKKSLLGVCHEEKSVLVTPPTNFPPFLRNPVDHINATVGDLLVFRVPDDTFYDPEDTDSRLLNISLLTSDRQPIKPSNWLQFDSKNREFYGIPRKAGRSEYQLVCVDTAGLPATDSLEIIVHPAPKLDFNVEFSMTVETQFDAFINSAAMQKRFVEKLQEIFGDRNSSYIHVNPFRQKQDSTIVTWYNKSLAAEHCPHVKIQELEAVLKNHDRSISSRVHSIMEPEFPVSTIKIMTSDNCRVVKAKTTVPPVVEEGGAAPVDEKAAASDEYQYLVTFIVPAVIISVMLFLAAVTACVLYRRRRTGKMSVEEDGRQSYGNKGIPVIFQEELDEKPDAGTKAPVILKDEKPPLAPPEYSKSGGSLKMAAAGGDLESEQLPYQPPPPFALNKENNNGRQPRPKPTPTYRKPPPYVPP